MVEVPELRVPLTNESVVATLDKIEENIPVVEHVSGVDLSGVVLDLMKKEVEPALEGILNTETTALLETIVPLRIEDAERNRSFISAPEGSPLNENWSEKRINPEVEEVIESIVDHIMEFVPESVPVEEPMVEPVVEPVEEPVVEPVEEPVVELVEEPMVEPVVEPMVEPVVEPMVEPVEEPAIATEVPVESVEETVIEKQSE